MKIKNCPKCKSGMVRTNGMKISGRKVIWVQCGRCDELGETCETESIAIEKWNNLERAE